MSEHDQSKCFGAFNLDSSISHHRSQNAEQDNQYEIEVVNSALNRMLLTFPETIRAIEEYLNDKSCTEQNFREFMDEVSTERMALLRTSKEWERLTNKNFESAIMSKIIALDNSSAQLINNLRLKLESMIPLSNPPVKSNHPSHSQHSKRPAPEKTWYSACLQKAPSLKGSLSQHSEHSKRSNASTTSMKVKLLTEAAAVSVDRKYAQVQSERAKRYADRDATRAKQQAEEEAEWARRLAIRQADETAEKVKNEAREREEELEMRAERLQAQLKAIELVETEESLENRSNVSLIPELTSEVKTETYVNNLPIEDNHSYTNFTPVFQNSSAVPAVLLERASTSNVSSNVRNPPTVDPRSLSLISPSAALEPKSKSTRTNPILTKPKVQISGHSPVNKYALSAPRDSNLETIVQTVTVPGIANPTNTFQGHAAPFPRIEAKTPERFNEIDNSTISTGIVDEHHTCSTDIIQTVCEQMALSRLPIMEPQVFTGHDPLSFPVWKVSFDALIHYKAITPTERLHFLSRYLGGEAKEAVQGFFMLPSQEAYEQSYELLVKRYGDQFGLSSSFRQKLKTWTKISGSDGMGLRQFVDFLKQCKTAMISFKALSILNDEVENAEITKKLPAWLIRQWTRKVATYRADTGEFPSFSEYVDFLSREEEVANDPLARLLQGNNASSEVKKADNRSSSFAAEAFRPPADGNRFGGCPLCRDKHFLH